MYENKCRRKFYELLDEYQRVSGYSPSQVLSVMVVMDCDEQEAMRLVDIEAENSDLDWSEASWYEMFEHFTELKETV